MKNSLTKNDNLDTDICNTIGCSNKATVRIVLPVGSKSLTIFVCEKCRLKFE